MEVNQVNKHLQDILTAISNIETSTVGLEPKHYDSYDISWIVERGIEIIAEALKRIVNIYANAPISNVQKIIGTRNKITHEYDVVDHYQLFIIVTKYLPVLKKEIQALINT